VDAAYDRCYEFGMRGAWCVACYVLCMTCCVLLIVYAILRGMRIVLCAMCVVISNVYAVYMLHDVCCTNAVC